MSHNKPIFEQRDILGQDDYLVTRMFLQKVLISENIVKLKFSEKWNPDTGKYAENIIGFLKTIVKMQLGYFIKEQYYKNLTEVTSAKNTDGLSGMDKMEMNLNKINEGLTILASVSVKTEMKRILRDNDFDITKEEIDYYKENWKPTDFQAGLIYDYWQRHFGSSRNRYEINRENTIILMLILKRRLLLNSGSEDSLFRNHAKLAYILSGNVNEKINKRLIRNSKYTSKVDDSELMKKLQETKYKNLMTIRPEIIMSCLSSVINTEWTYCCYEHPELTGKPIDFDENTVSDEMLVFIDSF